MRIWSKQPGVAFTFLLLAQGAFIATTRASRPLPEAGSLRSIRKLLTGPQHLDDAVALVNSLLETNGVNTYAESSSDSYIDWETPAASTKGSSFFTLLLKHSYGYTDQEIDDVFGSTNPDSEKYYDAILAGTQFVTKSIPSQLVPGDFIAVKKSDSGVSFMVHSLGGYVQCPGCKGDGSVAGYYNVVIVDSCSSKHGSSDTRHVNEGGIGIGTMRVYVDGGGSAAGYTWSNSSSSTYYPISQVGHLMALGTWIAELPSPPPSPSPPPPPPPTPCDGAHVNVAYDLIAALREPGAGINVYHSPGNIVWPDEPGLVSATSKCSSFLTLLLKKAYGYGDAVFQQMTGSTSPHAKDYYDNIVSGNQFIRKTNPGNLALGDIIAMKYQPGEDNTGHVMIVQAVSERKVDVRVDIQNDHPEVDGYYEITVMDSSNSYHYETDTRFQDNHVGGGVGRDGISRIFVNGQDVVTGYTWSKYSNSDYYPNVTEGRLIAMGRWITPC